MDANGPHRDDDNARKSEKHDKKTRSTGRPADAEDENGTAGIGVSFGVGAPQAADPNGDGPDVNIPSGEAASLGLDPDHGVSSNIPLADAQIPVPVGDQVVPVKAVLGLTLKGWAAIGGLILAGAVGISVANADDGTEPGSFPDPATESSGFGTEGTDPWGGDETTEYAEPDPVAEAGIGDCYYVSGDLSDVEVDIESTYCDTGAFRVLERYEGQSDTDACANDAYGDRARTYAAADSYFDVTLCLQIVYPDDIGYAEQYTCMVLYEDDSFSYADSCDTANVRVVGRTSDYEASGFCDGYGWSTWRNPDFPEHGYTVCWEWY
jgi:hypothetical protein